ncbi:Ceramide synthase 3 [Phlyctochytrium bullatum]|nr:Ceramide synthase 3 [Phlyctochytrium bullatum]
MPAPPESMLNKDLFFPQDLYLLGAWTLAWAVVHSAFKVFIKSISERFAVDSPPAAPTPAPSAANPSPSAKGDTKDASGLRNRKPAVANGKHSAPASAATPAKIVPKNAKKFATASWKFFNFTVASALGFYVLWHEPWALDPKQYFEGWPEKQDMSANVRLYYQISFGSCAYMLFSVFGDPKQKDFIVLMIHHVATVSVILVSYLYGFYRIGAVILLLHDVSDPFMEIAKMFVYAGYQKLADTFFIQFALVFIFTRNFIFPVYVISSAPLYAYHPDGQIVPYGRADVHYFCVGCLCVLCALHYYWAYLIVKMALKALIDKKVEGDIRDDDDD